MGFRIDIDALFAPQPVNIARLDRLADKIQTSPSVTPSLPALGIWAAARIAAREDTSEARISCSGRRCRELELLESAGPGAEEAAALLLQECRVCGLCAE